MEFLADTSIIDQIIDWFGSDVKFQKTDTDADSKVRVLIKASPAAMEYWAMQYMNYVEVITPIALREKIKENLENAAEKYRANEERK